MTVVVGGGAAGIFAALHAKAANSSQSVIVLEKTAVLLSKVKVSGGGRCNVTHACFDPKELVKNYPRGHKELLGPFHRFGPSDTIEWFESRGVKLKTEPDGRMFPVTNSSATIIDCLLNEAKQLGVDIRLRQRIEKIEPGFTLHLKEGKIDCEHLILATGSSLEGYQFAQGLGHTIQPPVPSLFTFNSPSSPLKDLSGIATIAKVQIVGTPFTQTGPLLITHFGFSGPAVLKLSAWAARHLHTCNYHFEIAIDWLPDQHLSPGDKIPLPKNLARRLSEKQLHDDRYLIEGKTTHKEEFVTCGGVTLKEVDFKTLQSKLSPGLHFAGELLDIDGVTGGFNFQNAWTTGFIAGSSLLM